MNAMMRRTFVFLFLTMILAPAAVDAGNVLKIGGTGGDLGTMKLLATEFERLHPDVVVEVLPSIGSSGGIRAVLAGIVNLGVSSRPLKKKERAAGARASAYSRTALVFAANISASKVAFTVQEIMAVVRGDQKTWPDGTPMRLVLRNESDGDIAILKAYSPNMRSALRDAYTQPGTAITYTDQENADLIEKVTSAIGITSLSLIRGEGRALIPLILDGAAPTPEAVADGSYPMVKTFYFVTRGESDGLAKQFLAMTRSSAGQAILRRTGHAQLEGVKNP